MVQDANYSTIVLMVTIIQAIKRVWLVTQVVHFVIFWMEDAIHVKMTIICSLVTATSGAVLKKNNFQVHLVGMVANYVTERSA